LRSDRSNDQDAFRRVAIDQVALVYETRVLPWLESVARPAHRSHLETAATYVSTSCGVFPGQRHSVGLPCGAPTSQRAMRWTDFCHLTSSYQYPRIVGSPCVKRLRAAEWRRSPVARQCDSLRRAAQTRKLLCGVFQHGGRCLPVALRACLASDTPVASPTRLVTLARTDLVRAAKTAFDPPA